MNTLQQRLAAGEVVLTEALPVGTPGVTDPDRVVPNAQAISRHLARFGLGPQAFTAPLAAIDPAVLEGASANGVHLPVDQTRHYGLFATAAAFAQFKQHGPAEPALAQAIHA